MRTTWSILPRIILFIGRKTVNFPPPLCSGRSVGRSDIGLILFTMSYQAPKATCRRPFPYSIPSRILVDCFLLHCPLSITLHFPFLSLTYTWSSNEYMWWRFWCSSYCIVFRYSQFLSVQTENTVVISRIASVSVTTTMSCVCVFGKMNVVRLTAYCSSWNPNWAGRITVGVCLYDIDK